MRNKLKMQIYRAFKLSYAKGTKTKACIQTWIVWGWQPQMHSDWRSSCGRSSVTERRMQQNALALVVFSSGYLICVHVFVLFVQRASGARDTSAAVSPHPVLPWKGGFPTPSLPTIASYPQFFSLLPTFPSLHFYHPLPSHWKGRGIYFNTATCQQWQVVLCHLDTPDR